jgi:hypothetical protein
MEFLSMEANRLKTWTEQPADGLGNHNIGEATVEPDGL